MNAIRRLLSWNTLLLLGSLCFLTAGLALIVQLADDPSTLKKQEGVVAGKRLYRLPDDDRDSLLALELTLTDGRLFRASRYAKRIDNLLAPGDSVALYTKALFPLFGNFIADEHGAVRNSDDPAEIFHLTTAQYEAPIIDFRENQDGLKRAAWGFPLAALLFFGLFLYRRSGKKSAFVLED